MFAVAITLKEHVENLFKEFEGDVSLPGALCGTCKKKYILLKKVKW